jgi:hypothetical protein
MGRLLQSLSKFFVLLGYGVRLAGKEGCWIEWHVHRRLGQLECVRVSRTPAGKRLSVNTVTVSTRCLRLRLFKTIERIRMSEIDNWGDSIMDRNLKLCK